MHAKFNQPLNMKILIKIVFVFVIGAVCNIASAQGQLKLAHINVEDLIQSMPDYDSAMVKMQKIQKGLQDEMELLTVEYNKKLDDYNTNGKNLTDLVRQSREQELIAMNQRMAGFREGAGETMEQENAKLMQPIWEKINKAIEAVAKEQGLTYVLTANQQVLLYKSMNSIDILSLVQKHMGIAAK